eukprot:COSAG02_NODE_6400_length_3599_cov_1.894571_2_plen_217_part_00
MLGTDRVGDSPSNDVAFGRAAGTKTALLDTGRRLQEGGNTQDPDIIVENLAHLAAHCWREFTVASSLTDPGLHAKRDAPVPCSHAATAAAAGDVHALSATAHESLVQADASGQTPLIWAADVGSLPAVKLLLSTDGIDTSLNAKGFLGATAVSRAARRGHDDCLRALLQHGADPNIPNDKLQYPMHFAAFKLNPSTVLGLEFLAIFYVHFSVLFSS